MIEKISKLKNSTQLNEVKVLCENAISALSNTIYKGVTPEAKFEIERISMTNLFEGLSKIENPEVKDWLNNQKRLYALKNLGVREAINKLKEAEAKENPALNQIINEFRYHIENDVPEIKLYEKFLSAMSSFSYYPVVGNAMAAIKDRVDNYQHDIDISKILEAMKTSRSNYLVPLIEDVVNNYLNNKSEQTKSSLNQVLLKFTYDDFVRDIVSIVSADATSLQLEYANAQSDIKKIYSPLIYLGENESVFNVEGFYYVKKGNNLNRLANSDVKKLDQAFVQLCETINNNNIVFENDEIRIYDNKDKAVINESEVIINGTKYSHKNINEGYDALALSGKAKFFELVNTLRHNFNEIAEVNFVKRVFLKENEGYAADIFKLRDNVFITTHNPAMGKATFYRNVNPIQAKNIMMEHLRFDVSKAFESILPQEEKILEEIAETKKSYSDYINYLEEEINVFKRKPASEITLNLVDTLQEELSEVKNEYKDYLHEVENYTRAAEVNEDITITIDADGKKYVVPIPTTSGGNANTNTNPEDKKETGEAGTVVGSSDVPASAVTFNDAESELLGDSPSIQSDEIDLGSDEAEAEAEKTEKEAEEKEEEKEEEETDASDKDVDFGDEDAEAGDNDDESEEDEKLKDDQEKKHEEEDEEDEEKLNDSAEGDGLKRDKFVVNEKKIKVYLKKKKEDKIEESIVTLKKNILNEGVQIGDSVMYNKQKGSIIGAQGDTWIVQVQGSTSWAKSSDLKVLGAKVETVKPPFKFDEATQKVLFEQFVRCGVYMGNTPIKTSNCYVKYSDWAKSANDQPINVMVEGQLNIMPKHHIRIYENINEFANPEGYIEGVIVDENEKAIENVMINVEDYTNGLGDSSPVKVLKNVGTQQPQLITVSKANLRTLSV